MYQLSGDTTVGMLLIISHQINDDCVLIPILFSENFKNVKVKLFDHTLQYVCASNLGMS